MDSLDLIETFCEVARRGSFSATARARGVSPASVSRAITQLEARFDLRLFHRTTRQVSLTDAGQILFERSGALLDLVNLTQGDLHARATHPSGRLAITAPHGLLQTELPPLLGHFMQQYPDVVIDLHVTDRVVSLAEEGIDLAFRVGPIPDANLIVRRLLPLKYVAAATPEYWRTHGGKPEHPNDLRTHAQLAYRRPDEAPRWVFNVKGKPFELPLQPVFGCTDHVPLVTLARMGLGVVWGAERAVSGPIECGELEPALEAFSPTDVWLYAVYQQRRHNSAALRAMLDHLGEFVKAFEQAAAQVAPCAEP
ncbi:MAG: LysR family transcriptional regulator [Burkholderiaceae bacterium]|nr:MAG: LysR family transcriptional regulator [Burkholderiaceae bacterium]